MARRARARHDSSVTRVSAMASSGRLGSNGHARSSSEGPRSDRRVARTHRALREALLESIRERGWDDVSVRDVCRRADVGRSTFYTHFADKEDVLISGLDELRETMRAELARRSAEPLAFAAPMIEHARDHWWIHRVLAGTRSGEVVRARFVGVVCQLVEDELATVAPPGPEREAAVRYIAGAFVELVGWSLEARDRVSAASVTELFHRATRPLLAELRRAR